MPLDACRVYEGSDGAQTRRLYGALKKVGPVGLIALNLFRAQKCSRRAKKYGPYAGVGGSSFRDLAYERKAYSLQQLVAVLFEHAAALGFRYGWGVDDGQMRNRWVLYIDIPQIGQVSFHSPERYDGPDYPEGWDGKRLSEQRIIKFCNGCLK